MTASTSWSKLKKKMICCCIAKSDKRSFGAYVLAYRVHQTNRFLLSKHQKNWINTWRRRSRTEAYHYQLKVTRLKTKKLSWLLRKQERTRKMKAWISTISSYARQNKPLRKNTQAGWIEGQVGEAGVVSRGWQVGQVGAVLRGWQSSVLQTAWYHSQLKS